MSILRFYPDVSHQKLWGQKQQPVFNEPSGDSDVGWSLIFSGIERAKEEGMDQDERISEPAENFYHNVPPISNPTYPKRTVLQTALSSAIHFCYHNPLHCLHSISLLPVLIQYINLVDSTVGALGGNAPHMGNYDKKGGVDLEIGGVKMKEGCSAPHG